MKRGLVLLRFVSAVIVLLFVVEVTECDAQKNATKRFERETFGKSRRSKPVKESGESRAAAKAMKEQAGKEAKGKRRMRKPLRRRGRGIIRSRARRRRCGWRTTAGTLLTGTRLKRQKERRSRRSRN
ncbi:MAG: hypothetical protein IPI37_04785 [Bacteroidales bacterium]|nr:hypothetical protein [Bacteroidales bacterium]